MGCAVRCLALVLVIGLSGCQGGAQDAGAVPLDVVVATCASTSGEVQVRRVGQVAWEPAQTGTAFRRGDWLRTGKRSSARLEYLASGSLEVHEDATVVVDGGATASARPLISVMSGAVRGAVRGASESAGFPIEFQTASGARFSIAGAPAAGDLEFEVIGTPEGAQVAARRGVAKLSVGEQAAESAPGTWVEVSAREVRAVKAPPAPDSAEPSDDKRVFCGPNGETVLRWNAVSQAAAYRVQIARDLSFQRLEVSEALKGTSFRFRPPAPGVYAWRVAAQDSRGRYGEWAVARRLFCEDHEPIDGLVGPRDAAKFEVAQPRAQVVFSWQPQAGTGEYRLVIARSADLRRDAVVSRITGEPQAQVDLEPGEYFWGVYVDQEPVAPLFLSPRRLVVVEASRAAALAAHGPGSVAAPHPVQVAAPGDKGAGAQGSPKSSDELTVPSSISDWGN